MSDIEPILESPKEIIKTFWRVVPRHNRDQYDVYVLRYHNQEPAYTTPSNSNTEGVTEFFKPWTEYVDATGRWTVALPNSEGVEGTIQPCLSLSGLLVHTLALQGVLIDDRSIVNKLEEICKRIWDQVSKIRESESTESIETITAE